MMYENKSILVLGLARSGYSVAKLLVKMGANVVVNDVNDEHSSEVVTELTDLGVELILGSHPSDLLERGFDMIVKNPGIPLTHTYIRQAKIMNIMITTEVEVAYNCMSDANYIAITGTNGKTTTSTLIYEMLKRTNKQVYLVGNIGNPISNYYDVYNSETIFVVEISAQQLYDCVNFKAHIAILTNLSEAHMEFFESKALYYQMKKAVFNNMTESDIAIINADCVDSLSNTFDIKPDKKFFSTSEIVDGGYYNDGFLIVGDTKIDTSIIKIVGKHNYQNILCAILCVKNFGVEDADIEAVLSEFRGVEHRVEFVRSVNGVKYYNDSKCTNIDACKVALSAFEQNTILILGGLERGQDFDELVRSMNYVTCVFCYGETKERIKSVFESYRIETIVCDNLHEATLKASKTANVGTIVLFSPACASWDQFANYEQRGEEFKYFVNHALK